MRRRALTVAAAVVALSLLASLAFAVLTIRSRPLENTEGCLLFEASRLRDGLALYTDPVAGALDYGPVPSRFHVLYPPVWSRILSFAPARLAAPAGRALSAVSWYGVLGWLAWGAWKRGRPAGVLAAAFVGGVYTLILYGASARPDGVAGALTAVALERSVRRGRSREAEGALFALAMWLKPNVIGLAPGVVAAQARAPGRFMLGWGAVTAATLAALQAQGGALFREHLGASMGQPLSLTQWEQQALFRAPFFALPLALALASGWAARGDPGVRIALASLGTSLAWSALSLAKIGSATCYWMEPCLGAVVVLAHAPLPALSRRWSLALTVAAPLQALWTGVGSIRSCAEAIVESPEKARAIAGVRTSLREGDVVLSDDSGVELDLDQRLVDTPFQTTWLARSGRFPEATWIADLDRPEIVGVVATSDVLERPLSEVDLLHDRYDVRLRRALRERFALTRTDAGYYVYARRR